MTDLAIPETSRAVMSTAVPNALVEWATAANAAHELATVITQTNFCPKPFRGKVGEATAAILAGAEVGLSPLAALNSFDDIQGTAAPKARTLLAIAQSQGHDIWLEKATDSEVIYRGQRRGSSKVQESKWTIDRARKLGVTSKDNWQKQPQTMLQARAASEIARLVAADALLGIPYSREEIEDQEPDSTRTVARNGTKRTVARKAVEAAPEPTLDETPDEPTTEPATEAPVEPDEPPLDDGPDPITQAQMKKMHASFNDLGITDRAERLRISSALLHAEIGSANELNKAQASDLIDVLEQISKVGDSSDLYAAAGLEVSPS